MNVEIYMGVTNIFDDIVDSIWTIECFDRGGNVNSILEDTERYSQPLQKDSGKVQEEVLKDSGKV